MKWLWFIILLIPALVWGGDMSKGMWPYGLKLGRPGASGDKANIEYTGKLSPVPADATSTYARLRDKGKKPKEDAVVYSGQMLDCDGEDDEFSISPISTSGTTFSYLFTVKTAGDFRSSVAVTPSSRFYLGATILGIGDAYVAHGVTIKDGNINRCAIIRSGDNGYMYVNGELVRTLTGCGNTEWTALTPLVTNYGGVRWLDGQIGNVQIWSRALTAEEVAADYANPENVDTSDPHLKGWWPLIEGSGDTAYDWSGNGNHGTLTNFDTATCWDAGKALSNPRVLQTAYMSWGMGSNILTDSDYLNPSGDWDTPYSAGSGTYTTNPDGSITFSMTDADSARVFLKRRYLHIDANTDYILSYRITESTNNFSMSTGLMSADGHYTADFTSEVGMHSILVNRENSVDNAYITIGIGNNNHEPAGNKSLTISHVQLEKASTRSAATITHSSSATNALVPIREWETAGQFTRGHNELNWNGKTKASETITIAKTVTLEAVVNISDVTALQYIMDGRYNSGSGYVNQTGGTIAASSGIVYVNGSASATITSGMCHVVVSGLTLDLTRLDFIADNTGANLLTGQMPLFRLWYDVIWDAATVAKYYSKSQTKYGVQ